MGCSVLLRAVGSDSPDPVQLPAYGRGWAVVGSDAGEGAMLKEDTQVERIIAQVAALNSGIGRPRQLTLRQAVKATR